MKIIPVQKYVSKKQEGNDQRKTEAQMANKQKAIAVDKLLTTMTWNIADSYIHLFLPQFYLFTTTFSVEQLKYTAYFNIHILRYLFPVCFISPPGRQVAFRAYLVSPAPPCIVELGKVKLHRAQAILSKTM